MKVIRSDLDMMSQQDLCCKSTQIQIKLVITKHTVLNLDFLLKTPKFAVAIILAYTK